MRTAFVNLKIVFPEASKPARAAGVLPDLSAHWRKPARLETLDAPIEIGPPD